MSISALLLLGLGGDIDEVVTLGLQPGVDVTPAVPTLPSDSDCSHPVCGTACEWIFARLRVLPKINGGSVVEWTLHPQFADPPPHSFQLQVGRTGNPYADDWENVGSPVLNSYSVVDSARRTYGKFQWTHYRVVLTTGVDSYASKPQPLTGNLSPADWRKAAAILREEELRLAQIPRTNGFLLKRRLFGEQCPCTDSLTDEVRDPNCTSCYGTGYVGGYYQAYPCFRVEHGPVSHRSHRDDSRGTVDDRPVTSARMLNFPQVFSYDVWVQYDSDLRWIVHSVQSAVEIRGMPLVLDPVELRLAPFSHPVYQFEVRS